MKIWFENKIYNHSFVLLCVFLLQVEFLRKELALLSHLVCSQVLYQANPSTPFSLPACLHNFRRQLTAVQHYEMLDGFLFCKLWHNAH